MNLLINRSVYYIDVATHSQNRLNIDVAASKVNAHWRRRMVYDASTIKCHVSP
jgi:hypothetical protein